MRNTYKYTKMYSGGEPQFVGGRCVPHYNSAYRSGKGYR